MYELKQAHLAWHAKLRCDFKQIFLRVAKCAMSFLLEGRNKEDEFKLI